jgi:uncharacterized protein YkwD
LQAQAKEFGHMDYVDGGFKTMVCEPGELASYAQSTWNESEFACAEWIGSHAAAEKLLGTREFGEYFGNEASTAEFYTQVFPSPSPG